MFLTHVRTGPESGDIAVPHPKSYGLFGLFSLTPTLENGNRAKWCFYSRVGPLVGSLRISKRMWRVRGGLIQAKSRRCNFKLDWWLGDACKDTHSRLCVRSRLQCSSNLSRLLGFLNLRCHILRICACIGCCAYTKENCIARCDIWVVNQWVRAFFCALDRCSLLRFAHRLHLKLANRLAILIE